MRLLRGVPLWCTAGGRILDLGTGGGANALFLANHGFRVDAVDANASAIDSLARRAAAQGLKIQARVLDVRSPDLDFAQYDAVICTFVLHFVGTDEANELLARARACAKPGAVHALAAITSDGEFYAGAPQGGAFYPEPGELANRYRDPGWTVHQTWEESRDSIATRPDGTPFKNLVASILASRNPAPM